MIVFPLESDDADQILDYAEPEPEWEGGGLGMSFISKVCFGFPFRSDDVDGGRGCSSPVRYAEPGVGDRGVAQSPPISMQNPIEGWFERGA